MSGINLYSLFSSWGNFTPNNAYPVQQAEIVQIPPNLALAKQAININGEVTANNQDGTTLIKTPQGTVTLKLQVALPVGSLLNLQIPTTMNTKDAYVQLKSGKPTSNKLLDTATEPQVKTTIPPPTISSLKKIDPQNTAVKKLQNTTHLANQTAARHNGTTHQISLNTGQSVRITPLPASLQNTAILNTEFISGEPTFQIDKVLTNIKPDISATTKPAINVQNQPYNSPRRSSELSQINKPATISLEKSSLPNFSSLRPVGKNLLPPTMVLHVSGDRTVRPMPTELKYSSPNVSDNRISTTVHNLTYAGTSFNQKTLDSHVQKITPLTHIRPPLTKSPVISMAPSSINVMPERISQLTLLNSFAGQIVLTSTGFLTLEGNPILELQLPQSQTQFFSINYPAKNLPEGTQVILSPMPFIKNGLATQPINNPNIPPELLNSFLERLPQQMAQNLLDLLPSTSNPRSFPAAALLFLAAANGGDLSAWIGSKLTRNIENLPQTNSKNTLQKMLADMLMSGSSKSATTSDPSPVQTKDWKGYQLPILTGLDIQTATIWVKNDLSDTNKNIPTLQSGTRFIVDLTLSRMGSVQFDGLIYEGRKTLDLTFSTERLLATAMQDKLKALWYNALENLDYSGSITFKNKDNV